MNRLNLPHLEELARLHERIEQAMQSVGANPCVHPDEEPAPALPLLLNQHIEPAFFVQAGDALRQFLENLSLEGLPEQFQQQCLLLQEQLRQMPAKAAQLIEEAVGVNPCVYPDEKEADNIQPGLVRFLAWQVLRKLLLSWRKTFADWLEQQAEEIRWNQPLCPFCGNGPALALLKSTRNGRKRLLVCGCCGLHWPWQRLACPFCQNEEHSQLSILELEDEDFRLDLCHQCQGFLKTCLKADADELVLADWTSLHLDALALEHGWQRRAMSLYAL